MYLQVGTFVETLFLVMKKFRLKQTEPQILKLYTKKDN